MSVIYDLLRVSDDGKSLFINAHVNKAKMFKDVYLKKITICTEELLKSNFENHQNKFIYLKDIIPEATISTVYDKTLILSEKQLLNNSINNGAGWHIEFTPKDNTESNIISIVFRGKFSALGDENTTLAPKLVVTTNSFNPSTDGVNSQEVLFTIEGTHHISKEGHKTWVFKGKGDIKYYEDIHFYLFKLYPQDTYSLVALDSTDNFNFLHFLWLIYSIHIEENTKELNIVLNKASFDEAFNNTGTEKQPIDNTLPIATNKFATNEYLDLNLSNHMFFVFIKTTAVPEEVPCSLGGETTIGVTFDYGVIFNQAMNLTRELADTCNIPLNYLNFIMNYNALKLSIETEHYIPAMTYWDNLMGNSKILGSNSVTTKSCGCHG